MGNWGQEELNRKAGGNESREEIGRVEGKGGETGKGRQGCTRLVGLTVGFVEGE